MARWRVNIEGKGLQRRSVEKFAGELKKEGHSVSVHDDSPPESRADRYAAAMSLIADARSEFESLRDELQEWHDNLPESFQNGEKGEALNSAISELEDSISDAENLEGRDVEFPGMY